MEDQGVPFDGSDDLVADSLGGVLRTCAALRACRLTAGLSIEEVAALGSGDPDAMACIDDGDLAAPVEAFAYYAAGLGMDLRIAVGAPAHGEGG